MSKEREKRVNSIWRGASQLPRYGSRLMDHWACYREIMYIHLMCEGSSLLFNIICSVLDVKSFYLSHQQHLNQLDTAVRYLTYRMYQHEVSVMSSLVKSGSGKVPDLYDIFTCNFCHDRGDVDVNYLVS